MNETEQQHPATGSDWWSRRPRRSERDRKIAGVAGGLGRAFGIDPVLIRVIFVVLTIFGGVGVFGYILGWLLLPSDSDEVSAAEALIGRGRSSVPPVLAVGLAIGALISLTTSFSWGLPFMPLVIGIAIFLVLSRKRGWGRAGRGSRWGRQWGQDWGRQWDEQWDKHWRKAEKHWGRWGNGCGDRPGPQSRTDGADRTDAGPAPASPFDQPAFWEKSETTGTSGSTPAAPGSTSTAPEPPSPPSWDPLGVAPFAWDLPDVDLTPPPPPAPKPSIVTRLTGPLAFIAAGVAAAGVLYGWWDLSWAQVSGIALGVVALGLFLAALRGRGSSLIGPGVILSIMTVALSITGLRGTDGYGQQDWVPTTGSQIQSDYRINAGEGNLDLRQITLAKGEVRDVTVSVGAGQATVLVPATMNVNLSCIATAGQADCLGVVSDGLNLSGKAVTANQTGKTDTGTLNLTVKVGAGQATVSHG